jgi:tetratricopeptide (TPR) repeat protein
MDFRPGPHPNPNTRTTDEVEQALKAAQLQLNARDYEGAWKTLQNAAALQPLSDVVLNAQVDVAMSWLRRLVVRAPQTFTAVVDQLTPVLYKALPGAKGVRAGDICAHIGWAFFLRSRENPSTVDVEAEIRKALELDPQNTYGHTMLAFRLLLDRGNLAEARRYFDAALTTKRDREWVREMQLRGLEWITSDDHKLESARVANEMRKNGENLSEDSREDLFMTLYWHGADFSYLTNLVQVLPASEHLATLNWLAGEDGWEKSWPQQRFVRARLKEQTGDWSAALEDYQNLGNVGAEYANEVKLGIARCKARGRTQ